jgi:hypothetical protein
MGTQPAANSLMLVSARGHSGALKSLLSIDSSDIRDVGVTGSNPVTPTIEILSIFLLHLTVGRNDAPHQDRQAVIVSSHYSGAVAGTAHRFTPTTDKSATRFEPEGIVLASPHVFPFAARLHVGAAPI